MNLKFEIGNWKLTRQGFTIIELLVAMSLLVMLLGLSGMVFNTTVAAHRAGGASIDVSRNLRAITNQLTTDFRGLQKDAPLFIAFNAFDTDGDAVLDSYYDTIHFFADGDFQTTKQYLYDNTGDGNPDGLKTVYSNIARIFYGHANSVNAVNNGFYDYADFGLLVRKSHLLTADGDIFSVYGEIPPITNAGMIDYSVFDNNLTGFGISSYSANYPDENELEFNAITLTNWINALNYLDLGVPDNADAFIANCMADASRPMVDLGDMRTLHLLLSQGVLQMRIQWAYTADDLVVPNLFAGVRWWPSIDPAGDSTVVSDFSNMNGGNPFGVYFMLPNGAINPDWFAVQGCGTGGVAFSSMFYPKALKFSFVLRDSNGVFADGKTFTHIVYIDN